MIHKIINEAIIPGSGLSPKPDLNRSKFQIIFEVRKQYISAFGSDIYCINETRRPTCWSFVHLLIFIRKFAMI